MAREMGTDYIGQCKAVKNRMFLRPRRFVSSFFPPRALTKRVVLPAFKESHCNPRYEQKGTACLKRQCWSVGG